MIKGSCCCGVVQFEIAKNPSMLGMCHCSRCRKIGASALAFVDSADFEIISGREKITTYKAHSPYKYDRCFCSICGTALGEILSDLESFPINANCIDSEFNGKVNFHEFVSEKPSWLEIGDGAKQFSGYPHD